MDTVAPAKLGSIAGVAIVILGLVLGWRAGFGLGDTSWWIFLSTAVIPVAFGVLIIIASEILSKMRNGDE